jgi:hypothetical protein
MIFYIHCIFPINRYCNCPYKNLNDNLCAYIEKQNYNSLLLRKEDDDLIEQMYTTKDKTLALLNIKSNRLAVSIIAKSILNIDHPCPMSKLLLSQYKMENNL